MSRLILPILILALLTSGLIIQLRNRSPYKGVMVDAQTAKRHRVGEILMMIGTAGYLIDFWLRQ